MRKQLPAFWLMLAAATFLNAAHSQQPDPSFKGEVIYHVFQRSFFDSNGDLQGDLNGLRMKLGYLKQLGITSILVLPVCESVFYHNYFAVDFAKIDPEYGTMQDWINLVKATHQHGMKIYLDMETQYVTEDQLWYKDSYGNPKSKYSDFILYDDSANKKPSSIIFDLTELKGYDGTTRKITTANLYSKNVLEYNYNLFKYFMDPDNNGKFDDGVDGFRLDHMMDDLDWKKRLTGLFQKFWSPLLTRLKQVNPKLTIIAEQATWGSFGFEYFEKGDVDRVFAFRLQQAIVSFDKNKLSAAADTTLGMLPDNKEQIVFIENHDMQRFASAVSHNPAKLKVGAALNLFLGGIPSIYYGQELGMYGSGGFNKFGSTDANDIPQREAFEWYKSDTGKGMALWYKNTGPWWDSTNLKPNDGISLQEEQNDPHSLWGFYKTIIHLHQSNAALAIGKYQTLTNNSEKIFSFLRYEKNKAVVVAVNLSDADQQAVIDLSNSKVRPTKHTILFGKENAGLSNNSLSVHLPPYAMDVWEIN